MAHRTSAPSLSLPLAALLALCALPVGAQEGGTVGYAGEEHCAAVLDDLLSRSGDVSAELNFVTLLCHASRLVDFKARTEGPADTGENGTVRSLPDPGSAAVEGASDLDRQIETATARSQESWEDLAQGDPQAAYDLLKRLIGERGTGN